MEIKTFTATAVQTLNERQCHLPMPALHPFTCPNRSEPGHGDEAGDHGVLIAIESGRVCPYCGYTQDYYYDGIISEMPPELLVRFNEMVPLSAQIQKVDQVG